MIDYRSYLSVNWQNPINWNHPLNKGTVAWWLNVPHWSGGTVWRDLGNRIHGTLTSMDPATDWAKGSRIGGWGELDFDATNDYIDVGGTDEMYFGNDDYCLSGWVNIGATGAHRGLLAKASTTTPVWFFHIRTTGTIRFQYKKDNNQNFRVETNGSTTVPDNTWTHILGQRTGTSGEIYIDGILQSITTQGTFGTMKVLASTTEIARRTQTAAQHFLLGRLDDVRAWRRSFSETEVADIYQLSLQYYPGLLNRWTDFNIDPPAAAAGTPYYYNWRRRVA